MRLTPKILEEDTNFELVEQINHSLLLPFVLKHSKLIRFPVVFFYVINFIFFTIFIYSLLNYISSNTFSILSLIFYLINGILLGCIIVIPIHEFLHIIAYKLIGAKKLKISSNIRKMYFYVTADKFVIEKKEFIFVALFPFLIINSILIWVILYSSNATIGIITSLFLFLHSLNCIGDFALINFVTSTKGKNVYTFDDSINKITYFYKIKN